MLHSRVISLSRPQKRLIMMLLDASLVVLCLWAALALRLGVWWPSANMSAVWWLFLMLPAMGLVIFSRLGLYRTMLRSMGRDGFVAIAYGVVILALAMSTASYMSGELVIPRSTPFIYGLLLAVSVTGARLFAQSYYIWLTARFVQKAPVLIYGAGNTGILLAQALELGTEMTPTAYVDDDPALQDSIIRGLPVEAPSQIGRIINDHAVKTVLLALPTISRSRREEILTVLSVHDVDVQSVPSLEDLISGQFTIDQLKKVELHDLLGRQAVDPVSNLATESVAGRSVIVTGAGGSIGSELCRQILAAKPSKLVLFEMSELALYEIDQELNDLVSTSGMATEIIAVLGNVCDQRHVTQTLTDHDIQVLYHAAAYKHVPIVEANVLEGVRNNIIGSYVVAKAARECGLDRAVLVSTDKAVRPTSVMGATKRLAELVFQDQQEQQGKTVFSMVRFGNVLDSSGSVIPLFQKQIKLGGPVTVTHRDITRYFMTIPEAAQLVIQAGSMAYGGDLFLLDMGDPVRIDDLARRLIMLSGLEVRDDDNPHGDIEIDYVGLRPGEKLYEELLIDGNAAPTLHPKIMRTIEQRLPAETLAMVIEELQVVVDAGDVSHAIQLLDGAVDGYKALSSQLPAPGPSKSGATSPNVLKVVK
jgi:FlaA1/EpsC-like NDP-sugar epimerase